MNRQSPKDLKGKNKNEYRLVLLTQTGDKQAFDELIQTVQENLYRHVFNITQDRALSDDLFQEVLIIIYKKIRWLRDPRFFRAWMYQIATRASFKALKKKKLFKEISLEETCELQKDPPDAERQLILKETFESVSSTIGSLSPASRSVLSLHYLEGMTLQEISDLIDIPIGTVKSRLSYGKFKLKEEMNKGIESTYKIAKSR